MKKYIQITLIPEEASGITAPILMSYVMERLHRIFVNIKDRKDRIPVGISFPEYDEHEPSLGKLLRLHGKEEYLDAMSVNKGMEPLKDYLHISSQRPVPERLLKGYVAYRRIRHDHSREKLIRRQMRRHGISHEQAKKAYENYDRDPFPEYPFVLMPSKSTGSQKYPLYLQQIFLNEPGENYFNTFGINPSAGVEYFK